MERLAFHGVEQVPPTETRILPSQHKSTSSVLCEKTNTLSLEDRIKPRTWQFRSLDS
jgi:hypothetical protein